MKFRSYFISQNENSQNSRTDAHFSARNFTSRHENYAGIDRTHRGLHFLPSLASRLSKLATGELGEVWEFSRKLTYFDKFWKYRDFAIFQNVQNENSQNSRTGAHFSARNFTSRHENYAGIDRTHRELHFLPSLASQLSKLATGELGEVWKISKILGHFG